MRYRNILCPVNFSASSRKAFDAAVELAREAQGELTLAHVVRLPPPEVTSSLLEPRYVMSRLAHAEQALADWRRDALGQGVAKVNVRNFDGVPWDRIVQEACDGHYDLVVVGSRGRSGLKRVLLGSVAGKVVRHAPCHVLVVR